jgi:TIR domain
MHDILISYSTKDKSWADAACSVMEAHGVRCWIAPRDIVPGAEWAEAIIEAIDACRVMVLIFSASANESADVRREVSRAISRGLPIVPCRIENVRPVGAMEYALGNTHWLDVFTPPVERQMNRLAESVEALLRAGGRDSSVVGAPAPAPAATLNQSAATLDTAGNWLTKRALAVATGVTLLGLVLACLTAIVMRPPKNLPARVETGVSQDASRTELPMPPVTSPAVSSSTGPAPNGLRRETRLARATKA